MYIQYVTTCVTLSPYPKTLIERGRGKEIEPGLIVSLENLFQICRKKRKNQKETYHIDRVVAVLGWIARVVNKDTIDNFRQIGDDGFSEVYSTGRYRERIARALRRRETHTGGGGGGLTTGWKSAAALMVDSPRSFWRGSNIGVCPVDRRAHATTPRRDATRRDAAVRFGKSYWVFNYGRGEREEWGEGVHTYTHIYI